jgi:hypothetical protein
MNDVGIDALFCGTFFIQKAIIITYSECVSVALDMEYSICMGYIILSSLTCLIPP